MTARNIFTDPSPDNPQPISKNDVIMQAMNEAYNRQHIKPGIISHDSMATQPQPMEDPVIIAIKNEAILAQMKDHEIKLLTQLLSDTATLARHLQQQLDEAWAAHAQQQQQYEKLHREMCEDWAKDRASLEKQIITLTMNNKPRQ